jgi:hypothetical protein
MPMSDQDKQDREKEALQSGAGSDVAYGQEPGKFGAGGQRRQRAYDQGRDDAPLRDLDRDESLPENAQPSRRKN